MDTWTEKYRPKSLDEIAGNKKAIKQLRDWAEQWQHGAPQHKAVVLSGMAGIGKTSAAHALAHDYGWEIVELNASDTRSGDTIRRVALSGAVTETFSQSGDYLTSGSGGRKLIFFDEADNLYETAGDKGGKRAIIDTIKATKQPIVLVVNDYYRLVKGNGVPLRSLCRHIQFWPVRDEMQHILHNICREEGVILTQDALRHLAVEAAGDARSAINDLQTVCQGKQQVGAESLKALGYRNRETKIFDGLRNIFRARDLQTASEIAWSIDEPPDYLILWMDENIPLEYKKPVDLAAAYHYLAAADVFLGRTRRRQHYALWRYASDLMFGGVAVAKSRAYPGSRQYRFPSYLRKMSASKATRTLRRSLTAKIGRYAHMSAKKTAGMLPLLQRLWEKNPSLAGHLVHYLEITEDELSIVLDAPHVKQVLSQATGNEAPPQSPSQHSIYDYD